MKAPAQITSSLPDMNLINKKVFLRADLNIPLKNNTILDSFRLEAILPTIDLILKKSGKIILATHIGRPTRPTPELSTKILIPWFKNKGYNITFNPNFDKNIIDDIVLLENLRFFDNESLPQQLSTLADIYVNDAFGLLHRADFTLIELPKLFKHKTIGLLIEKEFKELNKLVINPPQPLVLIIGGGKVKDKIPLLNNFLDKAQTILLCPAVAFTFLKALGKPVGQSLVDEQSLSFAEKFLKSHTNILLPIDFQVATDNFNGPLSNKDSVAPNEVGISIGPKTIKLFEKEILSSKAIFYNGLMGDLKRKDTLIGAKGIFEAMGKSKGFSVIGGGDSVAAAKLLNLDKNISYLSTGGGSTLAYLSGEDLPGLT